MALYPDEVVLLNLPGTIEAGDGKAKWKAPFAGEIVAVEGFITTLGTGTGGTKVQISNSTTDYLTTRGDFLVDSATGLMENAVLDINPTFAAAATIELDIDGIPENSDSANLLIRLWIKHAPVHGY